MKPLFYSPKWSDICSAISRTPLLLVALLLGYTAHTDLRAQELALDAETVCAREAPWNRADGLDARAEGIKKASDWRAPSLLSGHPVGKLSGLWAFKLEGLEGDKNFASAGRISFHQEGEGYECRGGCGYKRAKPDAKWLSAGERWGHINYGLRTADNPEDMPRGTITVSDDGAIDMPPPQYYSFPAIKARFDPKNEDSFTGTWSINRSSGKESGKAIFTRAKRTVSKIIFKSAVEHETDTTGKGCVAMDYGGTWWGPGNNMRGNRPGFDVEIYADNLFWSTFDHTKIWIDPATRLEIDSTSPQKILALDENGKATHKVIGVKLNLNIWSGTKWGPKTLYFDGVPLVFDYFVKPVYPVQLDPLEFQLAHGHFPKKPVIGQPTHLGFRLINLPDHAAKNTRLTLKFLDARSRSPAKDVKIVDEVCKPTGEGTVTCAFDETAIAGSEEVEFVIPMPDGGLRWVAEWRTEGNPESDHRADTIEPDNAPVIIHAFSVSDQSGVFRAQTKSWLYPYPGQGKVNQQREVILFGKNLPQKFGDQSDIVSFDSDISYQPRFGGAYTHRYEAAWIELSKRFKVPVEELKLDHQLLLLETKIGGRPLPGEKSLKLNGKLANWDLRFGGLNANLEFIREIGADKPLERIDGIYSAERIQVRVTTSEVLPLDHLPLILHLQNSDTDPARLARGDAKATALHKIRLNATSSAGRPDVYLSDPIRLVDKGKPHLSPPPKPGDLAIDVLVRGKGPDLLAVEIDPAFAVKSFSMPILPAAAALPISSTPGKHRSVRDSIQDTDYLFKTALAETAKCHPNIKVDDWGKLSLAEAEGFYNLVVITPNDHIRKTRARFAHHAAMLLMRKMFVELLNEQVVDYVQILQSPLAQKGFLKTIRFELGNDNLPINRVMVTAPDGSRVRFGDTALYNNIDYLARKFSSTPEKMAQWRLTATAEAISHIASGASDAAEKARQIGACEIEDLIALTGVGFDAVVNRLAPRLMRLAQTKDAGGQSHLYWEPDLAARYWTNDIARLHTRLTKQRQRAKDDTSGLALAFSLGIGPFVAGGSTAVGLILTGADLTLLGYDTAGDWQKYYADRVELDFSRDAAVVLGYSRAKTVTKQAMTWGGAASRTYLRVIAGIVSVASAKEHIVAGLFRQKNLAVKGRAAVRRLPPSGGLRQLSEPEQHSALIFAVRAKSRELAEGASALSAVERRAIDAVEFDFRAAQTELIANTRGSQTLGFGNQLTLPPPLGAKTAIVRFEPQELAVAGASRADDLPLQMARVADDAAVDASAVTRVGANTAAPPSMPPVSANPPRAPPADHTVNPALDNALVTAQTTEERALVLIKEMIWIRPAPGAAPIPLQLGGIRGAGSFTAAMESSTPFADFRTLVKVNFGGHDAADVYGKAVASRLGSANVAVPREVMSIDIPLGTSGYQRHFRNVSVVEDFGKTGEDILAEGPFTLVQREAIRRGLDDLNAAGYVMLDFKPNNFALPIIDGKPVFGLIDFGGIVRVRGGDAALAREIQNVTAAPWAEIRQASQEFGNWHGELVVKFRWVQRKELIKTKYADAFEDLDQVGVSSIDDLKFLPTAGETLGDETAQLFSAGVRGTGN